MRINDYCILPYLSSTDQSDFPLVARIIQIFNQKNITIADSQGVIYHSAFLSGSLKRQTTLVVGDFVRYEKIANSYRITTLLNRNNQLVKNTSAARKSVHVKNGIQLIAANLTDVFVVIACDQRFTISLLERYLLQFQLPNTKLRIILTKQDFQSDFLKIKQLILKSYPKLAIFAVSIYDQPSFAIFKKMLSNKSTSIFIGASGAGKSTIINQLAGQTLQKVGQVRFGDQRGKHTTTSARLYFINDHFGYLIDTPGIKEIGLTNTAGTDVFADIDDLAGHCRFKNCRHTNEPGCAIQAAIQTGQLDATRFQRYEKYRRELDHHHKNEQRKQR